MPVYDEDSGQAFGTWPNATARFMYDEAMECCVSDINALARVGDLGGGNGLLKRWLPNAVSVDHDPSKNPDVLDNIMSHVDEYDWLLLRYVLHYMDDAAVVALLAHLASYHKGRLKIIQFANHDLEVKQHNSVNETKFFRTPNQLTGLLTASADWALLRMSAAQYGVDEDFYRWRLQHPDPVGHNEFLMTYTFARAG